MNQKVQELAIKARNSLSKYCYTECKAYCCRKGHLLLNKKEASAVADGKILELLTKKRIIITKKGEYNLNLDANKNGCPRLKDFKCEIHNDKNMPKACREFPIFLWENKKVRVSSRCPAAREGLLYPFLIKFKKMGYEIC